MAINNAFQDVAELSGYFLGMNIYDQRGGGENHSTPPHSYPQPPPSTNQTVQNVQTVQPNYWQPPPPNQMPVSDRGGEKEIENSSEPPRRASAFVCFYDSFQPQQTMYFVPPPGTTISVGQNPGDRQQLHQQQRFPTNYSFNTQTMTPPSQANCTLRSLETHKSRVSLRLLHSTCVSANYVGSYPVPYNSVPAVTPSPGEYTYQPPVHMVPTYYPPGQPAAMQPPPVMYRVPTPPNTPTSNQVIDDLVVGLSRLRRASVNELSPIHPIQIPGMPLMYVNSSSYAPPVMSGGTFGHHQVTHNGTSPAPPGAYMASTLVPNLVFRQNVPVSKPRDAHDYGY